MGAALPVSGRIPTRVHQQGDSPAATPAPTDPFRLQRFVEAQEHVYAQALAELRAGQKRTHWMWFIFPQIRGLGSSPAAVRYAIGSREEALAYLGHPVLGQRLRAATAAVLRHPGRSVDEIFGYPDDLKFRSSMTLFAAVGEPGNPFAQALQIFFGGVPDPETRARLP